MDPTKNPFNPGAGTKPPELAGREEILSRASVAITRIKEGRQDRSALLIGLRGVGKTVLLNIIHEMAENAHFETAFLEAPEGRPLAEILAPPLRQILLTLDLKRGAADKLKRALGVLRAFASTFEIRIGDVGVGIKPPPGKADSGALASDVTDLLVAVGEAAKEKSTPVALFVDELQYVKDGELSALIAGLHRVSQLSLPLVLFGAGLPQLRGITGEAKSYAERLFHFENIGHLANDDAKAAIQEPIRSEGVQIQSGALTEIVRVTGGYPFFLQEWGKHTWNFAQTSPIGRSDVDSATPAAIAALDEGFFRVRLERLTPSEREYLRAMAELGPGPHRSGDVAKKLGRKADSLGPTRSKIISKGMAYAPDYGDVAFTVPMFDEYMKRAMPAFKPRVQRKKTTPKSRTKKKAT